MKQPPVERAITLASQTNMSAASVRRRSAAGRATRVDPGRMTRAPPPKKGGRSAFREARRSAQSVFSTRARSSGRALGVRGGASTRARPPPRQSRCTCTVAGRQGVRDADEGLSRAGGPGCVVVCKLTSMGSRRARGAISHHKQQARGSKQLVMTIIISRESDALPLRRLIL